MTEAEIFAELGEDGFTALTRSFYQRVRTDDLVGKMYPPTDWEGAEQRLRDFLIFRFGGSNRYIEQRGHPRLRMRHAPYKITQAARDRWVAMIDEAIEEQTFSDETSAALREFLGSVATFLINEPD